MPATLSCTHSSEARQEPSKLSGSGPWGTLLCGPRALTGHLAPIMHMPAALEPGCCVPVHVGYTTCFLLLSSAGSGGLLWPGLPSQEVAALLQEERKPARTQPLASCSSRPSSGTGNSVTKLTALAQRSSLSMGNSRFSFHTGWKEWVSSHSVRTCQGDCAWSPSPSSATELHASARPPKCCPHRSGKTE